MSPTQNWIHLNQVNSIALCTREVFIGSTHFRLPIWLFRMQTINEQDGTGDGNIFFGIEESQLDLVNPIFYSWNILQYFVSSVDTVSNTERQKAL